VSIFNRFVMHVSQSDRLIVVCIRTLINMTRKREPAFSVDAIENT
jgi:hypothetical protein